MHKEHIDVLTAAAEMLELGLPVHPNSLRRAAEFIESLSQVSAVPPGLPLNVEFSAAYLDGVMEVEPAEIRKQWQVIRKHLSAAPLPVQPQEPELFDLQMLARQSGLLTQIDIQHSSKQEALQKFARALLSVCSDKDAKRYEREAEVYAAERDHARACYERTVKLLTGIHALLYPPRMTDSDGKTWAFRSPMVHEQIQELSDRIRALPDEIAAIDAAMSQEGGE